jgi:Xaa-Pro aminopeptidase
MRQFYCEEGDEEENMEIFKARLESLREKLVEKELDAALVSKRENYVYLSGFTGSSALLLITQKDAVLITDFRYVEQAAAQAPLFEVVQYQGTIIPTLESLIKSKEISALGFEGSFLTYEKYVQFKEKLNIKGFITMGSLIENLRIIKDSQEINLIKEAVRISDSAFSHILQYIKPGIAELEIAAEMEYFMKKQGASSPSFETIVASGRRSAMPHASASEKKLEQGDAVTLDFGALYKGYCSDITRTVFIGSPDEKLLKIYNIVLEAQLRSLEGAHKGLTGKEVDQIGRDIITKAGYGNNFGHGLGHGVGLEIHEEPRLSPTGNIRLENGMAVTVEPGIYISGLGGVRIEDLVVINDDKPIILTEADKEVIIL